MVVPGRGLRRRLRAATQHLAITRQESGQRIRQLGVGQLLVEAHVETPKTCECRERRRRKRGLQLAQVVGHQVQLTKLPKCSDSLWQHLQPVAAQVQGRQCSQRRNLCGHLNEAVPAQIQSREPRPIENGQRNRPEIQGGQVQFVARLCQRGFQPPLVLGHTFGVQSMERGVCVAGAACRPIRLGCVAGRPQQPGIPLLVKEGWAGCCAPGSCRRSP
mmetsp:Transcript_96223/g.258732  ORF Transcript_96223/g.258732 Transcript_96223/m.258732 type:complete len:217 (+) Transcript_96223:367-1017(+)